MADRPVTFDEPTARRLLGLLRDRRNDPQPLRQDVPSVPQTARRHRWAKATTNYLAPTYPTSGNVVLVEFGEYQFTPPTSVNQTVSPTWVPYTTNPYDPGGFAFAVVPTGGTLPAEGDVVRVDLDDGVWWVRPTGAATPTPFVYLTNYARVLGSGSGTPASDEISAARYAAINFQDVYNDPSEAGVEVLTPSASTDPSFRITQDGLYEISVRMMGSDNTSWTTTDYRYDITYDGVNYRAFDTFHHSRAAIVLWWRAGSSGTYDNFLVNGYTERIFYGGYCNASGPPVSALTQGHWKTGAYEQASGWTLANLDAGAEVNVLATYYGNTAIVSTARKFHIESVELLIARHGDQVTPT